MTVRVNAFNTSTILGTAGARRTWAALTAACYLWMSTVVALRHTDVLVPVTPESIPAYGSSAPARQGDLPEHFNRARKSRSQPQECAACEWAGGERVSGLGRGAHSAAAGRARARGAYAHRVRTGVSRGLFLSCSSSPVALPCSTIGRNSNHVGAIAPRQGSPLPLAENAAFSGTGIGAHAAQQRMQRGAD